MRLPSRTLAALLVAGSIPLFAGAATAAPIGQSQGLLQGLNNAEMGTVEQVQFRRRGGHWRGGRWIGPAAGIAAGVAIGSALVGPRYYDDGYYAYGAAPGYVEPGYMKPGDAYQRRGGAAFSSPQYGGCSGDRDNDSGHPSWACR